MSSSRVPLEGMFIAVTGPSGSGKTSVCKALLEMFPQLRFSVSLTTRAPRPTESDGKDYHFISEAEFRDRIRRGDLIEWAENYGQLYGTSRENMEAALRGGHDLLLDVDTRGARALKKTWPGGIFVFVIPPSIEVLEKRLRGRGSETAETIRRRFDNALAEIREIVWYDYVVMNDELDAAIDCLRSIYVAEKCRRERMMVKIKPFFDRSGGM
jgi:guanylate kinase